MNPSEEETRQLTTWNSGASFFGIEMSFFWYRGGLSLLFGIEISFLVSRFCILLFSIYIVLFLGSNCPCFFGPRHPVKWRSKKISIPKRRSKNLDTQKKTSRYQLKESPENSLLLISWKYQGLGGIQERSWSMGFSWNFIVTLGIS